MHDRRRRDPIVFGYNPSLHMVFSIFPSNPPQLTQAMLLCLVHIRFCWIEHFVQKKKHVRKYTNEIQIVFTGKV